MLSPDQIRILLPALLGLPIAGAIAICWLPRAARGIALGTALIHLTLTGLVAVSAARTLAERPALKSAGEERNRIFVPEFVPGDPGTTARSGQTVDSHTTSWTLLPFMPPQRDKPASGVQFFIGLDGLNIWLVVLASVMLLPVVLFSWGTVREKPSGYFAWLLLLQAGLIGVFLSFDIILFYVCFELTLVPLFFLIGGWGAGSNRREAARKLFLFTLAGGLITLLGIIGIVLAVYSRTDGVLTFSIPELASIIQQRLAIADPAEREFWSNVQTYLFAALAVGFLVKVPVIPFHSWLPGAYSEGPVGVTVMLSALLAKMGVFGLVRICLPLAPDATLSFGLPFVGALAAVGIIYAALCAYAQPDFKRLVAYSSVSHLGFCVLAVLAFNAEGISGGVLHMVNHGLSTGLLFLLVGMLLQRYASGQIGDYGGLWARMPRFTFFMMVACLASVGLPGLCNFVSEMLMMSSLFDLRNAKATGMCFAVMAAAGIFLSAWYTLTMVRRAFFGPLKEPMTVEPGTAVDLSKREYLAVGPLAALCLIVGLAPQPLLKTMKRDVDALARAADTARERLKYPVTSLGAKPPAPVESRGPMEPKK